MASTQAPDAANIHLDLFKQLLSLYQEVVAVVYARKIKDATKLKQALEDERWRYHELPEMLEGKEVKRLSKSELERVVRWKITHGIHRPFLPGLIRKNDPSLVSTTTEALFQQFSTGSSSAASGKDNKFGLPAHVSSALKSLTGLRGVGPATASLVLAIAFPEEIPFFSDELFIWLCGSDRKLKYDVKEYALLFEAVEGLRRRLDGAVGAAEVEKVAFVVGHLDVLPERRREELLLSSTETVAGEGGGSEGRDGERGQAGTEKDGTKHRAAVVHGPPKTTATRPKGRKRTRSLVRLDEDEKAPSKATNGLPKRKKK